MQKANHPRNAKQIMTSSRRTISKTLLLLAAMLVPLQQSFAATCCCRQGSMSSRSDAAGMSCCAQKASSCCSSEATTPSSCCSGLQDSESVPCRCPAGSCGQDDPTTAEPPATSEIPSEQELALFAIPGSAASQPLVSQVRVVINPGLANFPRGADLCILLCRFAL